MGLLKGRRHKQTEEIFNPGKNKTGLRNQGKRHLAKTLKKPLKRRNKKAYFNEENSQ
tara:strand:+ start:959 stop:1129 length:171 start_codon:yes stop_codon:yes gene_type:complete